MDSPGALGQGGSMEVAMANSTRTRPLGVSVEYILGEFGDAAKAAATVAKQAEEQAGEPPEYPVDPSDPSFYDLSKVFWETDEECAEGICPRDRQRGCAIVDVLHSRGHAGEATHFLSWAWGYKVHMLVPNPIPDPGSTRCTCSWERSALG